MYNILVAYSTSHYWSW